MTKGREKGSGQEVLQYSRLIQLGVQESRQSVLKQENKTQGYRWEITDKRNENKILGGREGEREGFLFPTVLSGDGRCCLKVAKQGVKSFVYHPRLCG